MGCLLFVAFIVVIFVVSTCFIISPILGWVALVALVCGLIGLYYSLKSMEKEKEDYKVNEASQVRKKISEAKDFTPTEIFISEDHLLAIALDNSKQKVCFVFTNGKRINETFVLNSILYLYKDILHSEIQENGTSISSTSRSSQLAGAAIGGLLAGGIGALVGASGATQTISQKVNKLEMKIVVDDINHPTWYISFLEPVQAIIGFDIKSIAYQNARKDAERWHSLLKVLIRRADEEEDKMKHNEIVSSIDNASSRNATSSSVADELRKLGDLLKDELITKEEFEDHKKKLLN
ncbi:SHOCT domain-containing protein [Paenibacillus agricola]|uniref:SHOCT domain-containing protein n=1 Tax=Paenibacillus agricola TaxID=2716264 RepID=A0ABX0J6T4_9BACL|nr:SHOCT domain-containing protein [Paenibacillus agricola]NHN31491.1 SHOCT domain-containing protein [Paenibacillus agricola]